MDKQAILAQMTQIEDQIGNLYKELGGLKEQIVQMLEENTRLELENQAKRERLDSIQTNHENETTPSDLSSAEVSGEGHDNLARLYNEGFHICNVHYGSMRGNGDCLFCLSFLSKTSQEEK
ncbi:DNA replication initiation control protein YabA [Marininema halotolerans]|uniref:Replication initiation control protein YabA n=1 Tax=Marininema halotolerans TaxID=1155944 RepID=A0A1I6TDD4_9BACL|nr:DNA replication initiation control protein YabA [Marininema halotolerans]SFS87190.1 Regulator of replication initiation timing [Marininema halotolerans]